MTPFTQHTGITAPLLRDNIDTDTIIPSREMRSVSRSGLSEGLFAPWRYDDPNARTLNSAFVLNEAGFSGASILLSGANFGCGSSREHAPWALSDFGIKVVVSTSFADIFFNNCFKNGMLPIILPEEQVEILMNDSENGSNARIEVDLEAQTITSSDGNVFSFEVDPFKKHCLLNGLDDIGLTMEKSSSIEAFEKKLEIEQPWL